MVTSNLEAVADWEKEVYSLKKLDQTHWDLLKAVAPTINDPELCSKVYDVLRYNARTEDKGNFFAYTKTATENYLASAQRLRDQAITTANQKSALYEYSLQRAERALEISLQLGKNNKLFRDSVAYLESEVQRINTKPFPIFELSETIYQNNLIQLLIDYNECDPSIYLPIVQNEILKFDQLLGSTNNAETKTKLFIWKSKYLELEAQLYKINGDEVNARQSFLSSIIVRGLDYPKDGIRQKYLNSNEALFEAELALAKLLNESQRPALLRELGTFRPEIKLFNKEILRYQKASSKLPDRGRYFADEFLKLRPKSYDEATVDKIFNEGNALGKGKTSIELLNDLIQLDFLPKHKDLKAMLSPLERAIPAVVVDKDDKYKGVGVPEDGVNHHVFYRARVKQTEHAVLFYGALEALRKEQEGVIETPDFVLESAFIPQARQEIFRVGLNAILNGDYPKGIHLLIPQVEQSLRHILVLNGTIPSGLTSEQIQADFKLDQFLYQEETKTALIDIFGEDLYFNLRCLLVERFGSNLRNNIMHGLIADHQLPFTNVDGLYLSMLVMKMAEISTQRFGTNLLQLRSLNSINDSQIDQNSPEFKEGQQLVETQSIHRTLVGLANKILPRAGISHNRNLILGSLIGIASSIDLEKEVNKLYQYTILTSSNIVPEAQTILWFRGLHAALTGKPLEAIHFLIPQLEESLRDILEENGEITAMLIDDVQDDFTLGKLITTYKTELGQLIGVDEINQLELLLVSDQYGLRNKLAHGLLDPQDFISDEMIYLLGLTLKICVDKITRIKIPYKTN